MPLKLLRHVLDLVRVGIEQVPPAFDQRLCCLFILCHPPRSKRCGHWIGFDTSLPGGFNQWLKTFVVGNIAIHKLHLSGMCFQMSGEFSRSVEFG